MVNKANKESDTLAPGEDLNRIRKFRFHRRSNASERILDFSMVINHRVENYYLVEAKEYEAPQYVINHLSQLKDIQYFSSAETGEERTIATPMYYCELLD